MYANGHHHVMNTVVQTQKEESKTLPVQTRPLPFACARGNFQDAWPSTGNRTLHIGKRTWSRPEEWMEKIMKFNRQDVYKCLISIEDK